MQFLEPFLNTFQDYLERSKFTKDPQTLYDPCNYILDLGGKRIRPALLLMACELYDSEVDKALPAAMAVEVFHNFTLMHDDIMDESTIRRGKPTVHEAFSQNTAILSGDALMVHSVALMLKYEQELCYSLLHTFTKMAIELCEGQQMDMDFEVRKDVTITEYIKMIEMKTAVLLGTSLSMGANIGGASKEDQDHIYQFGKNIGIAFQIQDDILDTFGDDSIGKRIGGDILQNKKTYLYLKSLELADDILRKELIDIYHGSASLSESNKINRVTAIFKELVVAEYAQQVKEAYRDLAISHLMHLQLEPGKRKSLISFAEFLVGRSY